ncbi:MAG: histidine kinase [Planctomycetota bacterium]
MTSSWINLRFALGTAVFWSLFLVVNFFSSSIAADEVARRVIEQWPAFLTQVLTFWASTLIYFEWARRLGGHFLSRVRYAVALIGAVLVLSLVHTAITLLGVHLADGPTQWEWFASMWITAAMQHGAVLGAGVSANAFLLSERRRREISEVRLMALRNQMRPHFLFNTLQGIATMTRQDSSKAVRMIALLGDLLRQTLTERERSVVTLQEELAMLEPYLELQRLRFGDRLSIEVDVPPDLLTARVPDLLLQPLVENAIEHGIERDPGAGAVVVRARKNGENLELEVQDDGLGLDRELSRDGLGLGTTRSRLEGLFGARASLDLHPGSTRGTVAVVSLPLTEGRQVA